MVNLMKMFNMNTNLVNSQRNHFLILRIYVLSILMFFLFELTNVVFPKMIVTLGKKGM